MTISNVVVDLSHNNASVDLTAAKAEGILGVFLKATQGTSFTDPTFHQRRVQASNAGLLAGAYHYGTASDGTAQAAYFLKAVQPANDILLVLDLEHPVSDPPMSLVQAHDFVTHVFQATGKWPGLYGGSYIKSLLGSQRDPVLANCWFWLAQYGPTAVVPPNWPQWTFWQYTDGAVGPPPYQVTGIGRCDRDRFNGTTDDLSAFWANNAVTSA